MKQTISLLIILLLFPAVLDAKEIVYIAGLQSTKASYEKFISDKGGDPLKIHDYSSKYASRPVIALLIIVQALNAGGMDAQFEFIPYPNHARSLSELKKGKAHILDTDIWEQHFDDSVYKTAPLIRSGEFEKGIYTYAESGLLQSQPDLNSLLKLKPITGMAWTTDIACLRSMGFDKIETAPTYPLLFKMLSRRRADFTLLEFARGAGNHYNNDDVLYPVQGIKVVLPYSRHFMVSRKHSGGKDVYEALEKGLNILRRDGTIERALYQSGALCRDTRDWKIIWPEQNPKTEITE
ncbi:hypothetical protein [Maridesulfovibrio sp. FT414]|uniref:hypothetical protein n=1 Tax=Maridesulfovibrio sp. FT414 TaxID=2979469 RepID=UPI003D806D0B